MQDFLDAIVDVLLWVPLKLYGLLLDGLATVLEAIPIPAWASSVEGYASAISSSVLFYIQPFNLTEGVTILLGAYGIRFLIRRIPFIG